MFVPIGVNMVIATGAYFLSKSLIPSLKPMFLKANIAGIDMSKKDKVKM